MAKAEPQLTLAPELKDFDREELEAWLEGIRAKRLVATIEYHANKNAKLGHEADKLQKKFYGKLEKLGRALLAMENAEIKVQGYIDEIDQIKQEIGLVTERIVDPNEDIQAEDE